MKKLYVVNLICLVLWCHQVGAQESNLPSRLIDMGGYSMHFNDMGSGEKTIVIESGTGSWSLQWMKFQSELAKNFRVITYDRAGYGWSDPSPYSRTANNIADELNRGLSNLGVSGPYILLGHSYGGMIVKAFAKKYPDKVEALIFADAATEYQFEKLPESVNLLLLGSMDQFKAMGIKARNNELPFKYMPVDSSLNSNYWESYQRSISKASFYDAMFNEMDLLPLTYEQVKVNKKFSIPALIITAQNSFGAFSHIPNIPVEESNEIWLKLQRNLTEVSSKGQQRLLKDATHDLLLTRPNELRRAIVEFVNNL